MYLQLVWCNPNLYSHKDYIHPDMVYVYQNDDNRGGDPVQEMNVNPMQETVELLVNFR